MFRISLPKFNFYVWLTKTAGQHLTYTIMCSSKQTYGERPSAELCAVYLAGLFVHCLSQHLHIFK